MTRSATARWIAACCLAAACAHPASRARPLDGAQARAALEADAARRAAQVAADAGALDRWLHEDPVHRHADGREETKAGFIASLLSGAVDDREIRTERAGVYPCPGAAPGAGLCVVTAQALRVRVGGREFMVPGCATARYEAGGRGLALRAYVSRFRGPDAAPEECLP